uniref:A20-type domain-containing protein n=1 Tax=Syphacia muris TaxID=451379 RepID=A0A0N5B120_9BILA
AAESSFEKQLAGKESDLPYANFCASGCNFSTSVDKLSLAGGESLSSFQRCCSVSRDVCFCSQDVSGFSKLCLYCRTARVHVKESFSLFDPVCLSSSVVRKSSSIHADIGFDSEDLGFVNVGRLCSGCGCCLCVGFRRNRPAVSSKLCAARGCSYFKSLSVDSICSSCLSDELVEQNAFMSELRRYADSVACRCAEEAVVDIVKYFGDNVCSSSLQIVDNCRGWCTWSSPSSLTSIISPVGNASWVRSYSGMRVSKLTIRQHHSADSFPTTYSFVFCPSHRKAVYCLNQRNKDKPKSVLVRCRRASASDADRWKSCRLRSSISRVVDVKSNLEGLKINTTCNNKQEMGHKDSLMKKPKSALEDFTSTNENLVYFASADHLFDSSSKFHKNTGSYMKRVYSQPFIADHSARLSDNRTRDWKFKPKVSFQATPKTCKQETGLPDLSLSLPPKLKRKNSNNESLPLCDAKAECVQKLEKLAAVANSELLLSTPGKRREKSFAKTNAEDQVIEHFTNQEGSGKSEYLRAQRAIEFQRNEKTSFHKNDEHILSNKTTQDESIDGRGKFHSRNLSYNTNLSKDFYFESNEHGNAKPTDQLYAKETSFPSDLVSSKLYVSSQEKQIGRKRENPTDEKKTSVFNFNLISSAKNIFNEKWNENKPIFVFKDTEKTVSDQTSNRNLKSDVGISPGKVIHNENSELPYKGFESSNPMNNEKLDELTNLCGSLDGLTEDEIRHIKKVNEYAALSMSNSWTPYVDNNTFKEVKRLSLSQQISEEDNTIFSTVNTTTVGSTKLSTQADMNGKQFGRLIDSSNMQKISEPQPIQNLNTSKTEGGELIRVIEKEKESGTKQNDSNDVVSITRGIITGNQNQQKLTGRRNEQFDMKKIKKSFDQNSAFLAEQNASDAGDHHLIKTDSLSDIKSAQQLSIIEDISKRDEVPKKSNDNQVVKDIAVNKIGIKTAQDLAKTLRKNVTSNSVFEKHRTSDSTLYIEKENGLTEEELQHILMVTKLAEADSLLTNSNYVAGNHENLVDLSSSRSNTSGLSNFNVAKNKKTINNEKITTFDPHDSLNTKDYKNLTAEELAHIQKITEMAAKELGTTSAGIIIIENLESDVTEANDTKMVSKKTDQNSVSRDGIYDTELTLQKQYDAKVSKSVVNSENVMSKLVVDNKFIPTENVKYTIPAKVTFKEAKSFKSTEEDIVNSSPDVESVTKALRFGILDGRTYSTESEYSIKSIQELSKEPDVSKWYEEQLNSLKNSLCEEDEESIENDEFDEISDTETITDVNEVDGQSRILGDATEKPAIVTKIRSKLTATGKITVITTASTTARTVSMTTSTTAELLNTTTATAAETETTTQVVTAAAATIKTDINAKPIGANNDDNNDGASTDDNNLSRPAEESLFSSATKFNQISSVCCNNSDADHSKTALKHQLLVNTEEANDNVRKDNNQTTNILINADTNKQLKLSKTADKTAEMFGSLTKFAGDAFKGAKQATEQFAQAAQHAASTGDLTVIKISKCSLTAAKAHQKQHVPEQSIRPKIEIWLTREQ